MKNEKSKQSHKKALNKIYVGIDSSQIGMLIDKSNIKCVKCGLKTGLCDCWVKCPISGCSWSFEK